MTRSRFSLLGVLMAAVVLMALFASSAQAETNARWLVLKPDSGLYSNGELEADGQKFDAGLENNLGTLLSKVMGVKIAIKCTAGELLDALLAANASVKEGSKARFTGCTMRAGGADGLLEPAEGCEPRSAGSPVGTIETRNWHALARLHVLVSGGNHDIVLILPDNAQEELVNLVAGEECGFGENFPIFGLLAVQDCQGLALVHNTTHLISEFAALTKLYVITDTAEHLETKVDGSANIKLASGRSFAMSLK